MTKMMFLRESAHCPKDLSVLYRRWQAVAHEDTISPFEEASFINFNTNLRLSRVTIGNLTFAEWSGINASPLLLALFLAPS